MLSDWLQHYSVGTQLLLWSPLLFLVVATTLIVALIRHRESRPQVARALLLLGIVMIAAQSYLGLVWAPPEKFMGDTGRILYMHVPQLWMSMAALTINCVCSVLFLFKKSWVTDSMAEASGAVGVYFGAVGVALGSIWAKPTWGAWWTWDPRLTTAAILLVAYSGYMALRKFIDDPDKRAVFSSVMGIFSGTLIPVLWFSVRWWRSMHQTQSTPKLVDPQMVMVLRFSAVAFLCLLASFLYYRFEVAMSARARETAPPPEAFDNATLSSNKVPA
jgi:heme exporter protein C